MTDEPVRCAWCKGDPLMIEYHDREWGVPTFDDRTLFEFLVLEGAQAGLSWITILRKRPAYREAFSDFDPEKVARYDARRIERLLLHPGIVKNRLKIESAVKNARAFLKVQQEFGSFADYQWRFTGGGPVQNQRRTMQDIPARTDLSDAFSKDLKRRGFTFVGSTIIYAHMQAVGMVNDHVTDCFRYSPVKQAAKTIPSHLAAKPSHAPTQTEPAAAKTKTPAAPAKPKTAPAKKKTAPARSRSKTKRRSAKATSRA